MAILAMAAPILPGKTEQFQRFVAELQGARKREYSELSRKMGIRERIFLQSTPQGDVAILVHEGDDPQGAATRIPSSPDEFTRWYLQQVKEIHGFDLTQPSTQTGSGSPPSLVADSGASGFSAR